MACAACETCAFERRGAVVVHEVHVTVTGATYESFRAACSDINVKPLLIYNIRRDGAELVDMLSSSRVTGSDQAAFAEMQRVAEALRHAGFAVAREKIETAPWNVAVPRRDNDIRLGPAQYFEAHIGIELDPSRRAALDQVIRIDDLYLSRNVMKQPAIAGDDVVMATLRARSMTLEQFEARLDQVKRHLACRELFTDRVIVEFALFDSCAEHDSSWMAN